MLKTSLLVHFVFMNNNEFQVNSVRKFGKMVHFIDFLARSVQPYSQATSRFCSLRSNMCTIKHYCPDFGAKSWLYVQSLQLGRYKLDNWTFYCIFYGLSSQQIRSKEQQLHRSLFNCSLLKPWVGLWLILLKVTSMEFIYSLKHF